MTAISTITIRLLAVLCGALAIGAFAAEKLYRVNSKDVGWTDIDLTISEVRREARISVLRIPNYERRSAAEARFAMCAFTDIAIQRGFDVWIVSDGSITDNIVRVGFLKSNNEDPAKVLGREFAGAEALRTEVAVINKMCGIRRGK